MTGDIWASPPQLSVYLCAVSAPLSLLSCPSLGRILGLPQRGGQNRDHVGSDGEKQPWAGHLGVWAQSDPDNSAPSWASSNQKVFKVPQ